jgi:alcohol dehydrogenase
MNYQFTLPTKVIVERGIAARVSDHLSPYGITKVLILTDRGIKQAGLLERIYRNLSSAGLEYVEYDEIKPNPRDTDCDLAAAFAREHGVDGILAVGGGSVMDTAKAVGVLLTHGGSINDWEGTSVLHKAITPLICVPTTAGTGSEVTFISVITDTKRKIKMGIVDIHIAPKVALLDPELTVSLPAHITASTGMDALTHAIEAYTSRLASPVTDALALHAIKLIRENLLEAVENGSNLEARENMMIASLIAGAAFGNSDVGSVHCISEAIGGLYDTPHGVANSIFLPYVFRHNIIADIERHATVAYALGADRNLPAAEAAEKGVELLFELSEKINIPRFRDLPSVNPDDFPALAKVSKNTPMDASNAREMSEEDYLAIIRMAY